MTEHDEPDTFTWTAPDGTAYEVPVANDVDSWTGREMRSIERLAGGPWSDLGPVGKRGLIYTLSVARVVPGATIETIDGQMTVGRILSITEQIKARDEARIDAQAAAEAEAAAAVPAGDDVLSPTSAGSEA